MPNKNNFENAFKSLDEIFNEENYRYYLESYRHWKDDGIIVPELKEYVDKCYSKEELQKIVDDTKTFANYIIEEMKNNNSTSLRLELWDSRDVSVWHLIPYYKLDTLFNPMDFNGDFYFSEDLLRMFFNGKMAIYSREEVHFEGTCDEYYEFVRYIHITMTKEQFNEYSINNYKIKSKKI